VDVRIPAGVATGNYITIRGEGDAGPRGGPAGDVFVMIKEKPDPLFERHGDDLLYHLTVNIAQAVLGSDVEVPTLTGKAKLTIDPGTPSGKMLRMRGKGIPHLHGSGRGDQLVHLTVWMPSRLSKNTRHLFEELSKQPDISPETGPA
jgi:molecular chaperone DnaJ